MGPDAFGPPRSMAMVWLESAPARLVTTVEVVGELISPSKTTTRAAGSAASGANTITRWPAVTRSPGLRISRALREMLLTEVPFLLPMSCTVQSSPSGSNAKCWRESPASSGKQSSAALERPIDRRAPVSGTVFISPSGHWMRSSRDMVRSSELHKAEPYATLCHQLTPQGAVVFQEALGLFAFGGFAQRPAVVAALFHQAEQLLIGIVAGQFGDVAALQPGTQKVEAGFDAAVHHVGGIGIPAQPDVLVIGGAHDFGGDGGHLGFRSMDFQPDLHAMHVAVIADFAQARREVLDGGLLVDALGQPVGPHLDAEGARVVREADELLGQIDLPLALGSVGGLELASGAEAEQPHLAVLEAILHLGAFGVGERGLDSMFVAGAKFDGIESGGLQGPDDGFQIHIVEDVIGDGA